MSSMNALCGDCTNFKPEPGAKFFNCNFGKHAGVKYGMQVRGDTVSCEAFVSRPRSAQSQTNPKRVPPAGSERAEPAHKGLCNWVRGLLLAIVIVTILLIVWGAYTCFSASGAPSPTQSPEPTTTGSSPSPTGVTPTPSATVAPIYYYNLGDRVQSANSLVTILSVEKTSSYNTPGTVPAPPGTFFIFASITMFNTSSSSISVAATDFSLLDSSGIRYGPRILANSFYGAFPFAATKLQPGGVVSGKILYVVSDQSSELEIQTTLDGYRLGWKLPY